MSRVALLGEGPLPGPGDAATGFAQLRLAQLREGLEMDGHDVRVVDVRVEDARAAVRAARPDAVISAGTWGPVRAAVAAVDDEPLCVDLPGDPFADAQAAAAFGERDRVADAAAAVFVPALLRADHFTTISGPSRFSLLGQLGVLGRLARTPPGEEWASIAPVAWAFPGLPEAPRRPVARGTVRVALVGSFNTWFDGETLLDGLLRAMDRAGVEVDVVGGPVAGHHEATYRRFRAAAEASPHAARFRFGDRLPAEALATHLAEAHVGVCLDRPGFEPELGSRTRLLLYLHQGLRVVATARCELARELADGGWIAAVPQGDAEAVARGILDGPSPPDRGSLRVRYGVAATTAGLRTWAAAPRRRAIVGEADATGALARERDALRAELDAVRGSATWKVLDRVRRLGPRLDKK